MINNLIEKYKKIVIASNEIVEEQRQQRFPDEVTIRSEITRFHAYETAIKDLEELKEKMQTRKNSLLKREEEKKDIAKLYVIGIADIINEIIGE